MERTRTAGKKGRTRGRPSLPKGEGKRHAIGLRVTAGLRHSLEAAVTASGRSLSQEAEFRLEQSFRDEAAYGGRELAGLFRMMAGAAAMIEARRDGKKWSEDYETGMAARAAWQSLIRHAIPPMPDAMAREMRTEEVRDPPPAAPELPPPMPPNVPGLLGGYPHTPEQLAANAAAQAKYNKEVAEWKENYAAYIQAREAETRRLRGFMDHFAELENLGRALAEQLIPPRGDAKTKPWHSDW